MKTQAEALNMVHKLTNLQQAIIGYIELQKFDKAAIAAKDATDVLKDLRDHLMRLAGSNVHVMRKKK